MLDPVPLIDARMLELTRWMADYYACSWGQALDAAVPAGVRKQAGTRVGTFLAGPRGGPPGAEGPDARSPGSRPSRPRRWRSSAGPDEPLTIADVCRLARCATGPVRPCGGRDLVHTVRRRLTLGQDASAGVMPASRTSRAGIDAAAERDAGSSRTHRLPGPIVAGWS